MKKIKNNPFIFSLLAVVILSVLSIPYFFIGNSSVSKADSLPDYTIGITGKEPLTFNSQKDNIAINFQVTPTEEKVVPKGTKITLNVGKSMDLQKLSKGQVPAYVTITTDADAGTITIEFTKDLDSAGAVGFQMTAPANVAGDYTVTASSDLWGSDMTVGNNTFTVMPYEPNPSAWNKNYFDLSDSVLSKSPKPFENNSIQASYLTNSNDGTSVTYTFSNDGNMTALISDVNVTSLNLLDTIKPGQDHWTWQNGDTPQDQTLLAGYTLKNPDAGASLDLDHIFVYDTTTSADLTSEFKVVTNPNNPKNDFFVTPSKAIPAKDAHFAIIIPVKYTNADSKASVTADIRYAATQQQQDKLNTVFDKAPNSKNFIPRIYSSFETKHIPYKQDKIALLKAHEGITAKDVEDGDLTSSIDYDEDSYNNLDTSTPGTYTVIYKVSDKDHNVATKSVQYVVDPPEQPGKITLHFEDTKHNKLRDDVTVVPGADAYIGGSYDYTETHNKYDDVILKTYKYKEASSNVKGTYTASPLDITYTYDGEKALTSPESISFGTHSIATPDQTYAMEALPDKQNLSLIDTLPNSNGWTLSGQLSAPLKGETDQDDFPGSLYYSKDGKTSQDMSVQTTVASGTDKEKNISDEWTNGKGLKLETNGYPHGETYQGTITWTLTDGVSNN